MKICVLNQIIEFKDGLTIGQIYKNILPDKNVYGAYIGEKFFHADTIIKNDASMSAVFEDSDDGYRIYRNSLSLLLIMAINAVFKNAKFTIRHGINHSTYCKIYDESFDMSKVQTIKSFMLDTVRKKHKFILKTADMRKAEELLQFKEGDSLITPRENMMLFENDGKYYPVYSEILPHAGYLDEFEVLYFDNGIMMRYPNRFLKRKLDVAISGEKVYKTMREYALQNEITGIGNVFTLNKLVRENKTAECINIAEILHEKSIANIADKIKNDMPRKKIILISGPSASGKTTFANRLSMHLKVNGINPIIISLDDYFWGVSHCEKDENGEYDFEGIDALDYKLFCKQVSELINGEEVLTPLFDFTTGERKTQGRKLKLSPDSVIIAEGIHALNPKLTQGIPSHAKYRIYCSALTVIAYDSYTNISPTDTRLLRRIIRDNNFRNSDAANTFSMWTSVQKGEVENVFPFEEYADDVFNSALAYEFSAYKNKVEPLLKKAMAYSEYVPVAQRLLKLLSYFEPMDDKYIPPTSVIREFIGNSSINY